MKLHRDPLTHKNIVIEILYSYVNIHTADAEVVVTHTFYFVQSADLHQVI